MGFLRRLVPSSISLPASSSSRGSPPSSCSSPQISSTSERVRLRLRSQSCEDGETGGWSPPISLSDGSVSDGSEESVSTKPRPGDRALAPVGGGPTGSWFRRHERARTPVRRMAVPNAIYPLCWHDIRIYRKTGVEKHTKQP